jgi:hypothetical protein
MIQNERDRKEGIGKKGQKKGTRQLFFKKVAWPLFLIGWIFFGK